MRKQTTLAVSLVLFVSVAASVTRGQREPADEPDSSDMKIRKLLVQRREILAERVKFLEAGRSTGTTPMVAVLSALDDLIDAELELAENREQRIDLRQRRLKNTQLLEERARHQNASGIGDREALLLATATRLQAEIELRREEVEDEG